MGGRSPQPSPEHSDRSNPPNERVLQTGITRSSKACPAVLDARTDVEVREKSVLVKADRGGPAPPPRGPKPGEAAAKWRRGARPPLCAQPRRHARAEVHKHTPDARAHAPAESQAHEPGLCDLACHLPRGPVGPAPRGRAHLGLARSRRPPRPAHEDPTPDRPRRPATERRAGPAATRAIAPRKIEDMASEKIVI